MVSTPTAPRGSSESYRDTAAELRYADRHGISPTALRAEIRALKREYFVLSRELREIVKPSLRQRHARDMATIESRLMERGVSV